MIELALTFGRMAPARFPLARRLVLWLPGLCQGLLVECDLSFRPESMLLVVVAHLAREEPTVARRVAFWTGRAGGHPTPLVSLGAAQGSAYRHLLAACRYHRLGVPPDLLPDALASAAAAVGISAAPEPDGAGPVLDLDEAGVWDGVIHDRRRARLFLPGPSTPPLGDEFGLRLHGPDPDRPLESRARVVDVVPPGLHGPGAPAGFTLKLPAAPQALHESLARLVGGRPGARRAAPRYPVRVPIPVNVSLADGAEPAGLGVRTLPGRLTDLSQGGAFIATDQPLPPGTEVRLEIRVPGQAGMEAAATVVRDTESGMGVRFHLDQAGEEKLADLIAGLATLQRRVLVVDDDVLARRIISDALAGRGFEVLSAAGAAEGLQVLTDELLAFDLLVTDLRMPDIDGESFIRMVRQAGGERDLAIVAVTGSLDPFVEARVREMGADAILDKAAGAASLAEAAEAALARKRDAVDG